MRLTVEVTLGHHLWVAAFELFLSFRVLFPLILFFFFLLRNVCLTFTEIPYTKPEMPDAPLAINKPLALALKVNRKQLL